MKSHQFMLPKLVETDSPCIGRAVTEYVQTKSGPRLKCRGVFGAVDRTNENGRKYPRPVWQRNLGEASPLIQRIASRMVLGELEHPESGMTHLARVSHIIEGAWLEDLNADNEYGVEAGTYIVGEYTVFNTPHGLILQELHDAGVPVGVSSRGRGDVETVDGIDIVQDNYDCETWDCVYNPSVVEAFPKPVVGESEALTIKDSLAKVRALLVKADRVDETDIPALAELGAELEQIQEKLGGSRQERSKNAVQTVEETLDLIRKKIGESTAPIRTGKDESNMKTKSKTEKTDADEKLDLVTVMVDEVFSARARATEKADDTDADDKSTDQPKDKSKSKAEVEAVPPEKYRRLRLVCSALVRRGQRGDAAFAAAEAKLNNAVKLGTRMSERLKTVTEELYKAKRESPDGGKADPKTRAKPGRAARFTRRRGESKYPTTEGEKTKQPGRKPKTETVEPGRVHNPAGDRRGGSVQERSGGDEQPTIFASVAAKCDGPELRESAAAEKKKAQRR